LKLLARRSVRRTRLAAPYCADAGGVEPKAVIALGAPTWSQGIRISAQRAVRSLQFAARRHARRIFAALLARPLLRLAIGRWPRRDEARRFTQGFTDDVMLPPMLRALAGVPSAREPLTRTMLASWMLADAIYRGRLRDGLDPTAVESHGDVLRVWTGPPIAFMHIAKTGGTSAMEMLLSAFHPLQIAPQQDVRAVIDRRRIEPGAVVPAVWKYALVAGHFDYPDLRLIDRSRAIITFFRDPARRILSLYYYWRSFDEARIPASDITPEIRSAWSLPLLEFLRCDHPNVRSMIENGYVRRLTGLQPWSVPGDPVIHDPEQTLRAAAVAMADIAFVGITERMRESIAALTRQFEFEASPTPPRVNVAEVNESGPWARFRPVPREPLTAEIQSELTRLTQLDHVIYGAACARLDAALGVSRQAD
jgi:hypothetical protein